MKKILLINLILFQSLIFSQESLSGKYCHSFDDNYSCVNFLENRRFEYNSGGDLGDSYIGAGKYQLVNKELILIFDKAEKVYQSIIEIKSIQTKSNDSIKLNFHFFDSNKIELPFTYVGKDSLSTFSADKFGNLEIIEPKNTSENTYKIWFIGYETLSINLKMDSDKEIIIFLSQWTPKIISSEIIKYELIEIRDSYFKTSESHPYHPYEKNGLIYKKVIK
ncbi:hypothetical protein [Lutibacter maritimus]|uniref:Uncharacterized protein n=1 Tax=Lutibacter maritimus TaxID=593133 RepID=A0A1I6SVW0_9FLAO|nr:hypothetical protein [Lutibacter maritimus]SFS81101.1 hypothetical protein SAMN04488006_0157 [Lutibacter maritimus]